jgi:hypothetical protein
VPSTVRSRKSIISLRMRPKVGKVYRENARKLICNLRKVNHRCSFDRRVREQAQETPPNDDARHGREAS